MPNRATPPPVADEQRANGASPGQVPEGDTAAGPSGPRMPKRIEWLDLPEPYQSLRLRVWTNFPHRVLQALDAPKTTDELEQSLRAVVLEHNGWLGDDGEPLPDAQSDGFWWGPQISAELVSVVRVWLTTVVPFVLPRSMRPVAQRSGRTAP